MKKIISLVLVFILTAVQFKNMNVTAKTATTTGSTTTANDSQRMFGDANGDGVIDAVDAALVLSVYAKIQTGKEFNLSEAQFVAMDVDKNKVIDGADAAGILSYYSYVQTGGKDNSEGFFSKKYDRNKDTSIVAQLYNRMSVDKVLGILGENYIDTSWSNNKISHSYSIDSVDRFSIDMKSTLFTEFSPGDGKLINYGYAIGRVMDGVYDSHPYSKDELLAAYNAILRTLKQWYGPGTDTTNDFIDYGVLKGYSWDTVYGEIWFIVGVDLWGIPGELPGTGINEIVLSCSIEQSDE